ncbi:hypothetical protein CNMCM8980_002617 [Aspergillus fumigatiaffinis]|uniref:Zn(2)-C6 fungal-type domain-containing protein n=1 Tax=Aspergillus fumigatiaffinis TaxID=340414 RepID=A0A8H4M5R5_9EURO|nr:hypothetical protein CNMCM5878_002965 [Aspergillus fumigatiaffinis]KAF4229439.1 hypothetical protein CNMCM6805_001485 [Aspergillus fumigatiaffinis]KAF4237186.1 hypothetical protein CNMCM8980_002617 [Aspergillus fumigatiaffinis]
MLRALLSFGQRNTEYIFPTVDPTKDGPDCKQDCADCTVEFPSKVKIESLTPLYGHIKRFDTHVLVATGKSDWVERVTQEKGSLMEALDSVKPRQGRMMISASNLRSPEDLETEKDNEGNTVLILPSFTFVDCVKTEDVRELVDRYIDTPQDAATSQSDSALMSRPCEYDYVVLLCSHKRRDARCGITAPLIKKELERHLRPLDLYRDAHDERPGGVGIFFVSHVGGHKFAANVMIYRKKEQQMIWLARVRPEHCEGIVKYTLLQGKVQKMGPPDPEQPQPPEQRVRKRRRRTMACTQCRSRKLRCDREYPTCGRCLKSKTPTKCTYEDGFLWQQPNTVASPVFSDRGSTVLAQMPRVDRAPALTTPDSGISSLPPRPQPPLPSTPHGRHGEEKRSFLETVLGAPKAGVNQEPYVNTEVLQRPRHAPESRHEAQSQPLEDNDELASPSQQLDILPRMMMRGKETKTRFNGSGILANLIAQFPDIRSFAEEVRLSSPNLTQLRFDLERVKRGLWKRKPLNESFPVPDTKSLIDMLPSRRTVDELVVLYLTCIESTHRILHVPSFLKELDEFWAQKDNPDLVSTGFVVQLLLVLACAWNLADFDTLQLKNEASLKCYTPVEWVLHVEKWLDNAHIKRPEITALRIQILLIIAQNSFGMKRSLAWLATGTLVKQAMMAGYHRDPSRYTKISVFNKEMRRRIWTTIVELDLQVALERGMPPSVQESDYDTAPASNINDNEIQETSTELPGEAPLHEITDSSFQAVLTQSLPLRLKACALMHSPRVSCRYEEIQRLDWELGRYLQKIPAWPTAENDDYQSKNKVTLLKSLLETKIAHSLLSVHTPFAIEAPREPLFALSARSRLEVATLILSNQKRLHETSKQLSLCNFGEWTMQAFCTVCQILHAGSSAHASSPTFLTHTLPGLPESLVSLLEMVLASVETRLLLVVKGAKEYFFMSTLLALVKAKLWPAQANVYKQEVVDRVIYFAQTLFSRHANCAHLGDRGQGCFGTDQVPSLTSGPGMAPPFAADPNGALQSPGFGIVPYGEIDPFLEVFDWADLTGITLGE